MDMPGRNYGTQGRYGFNGKERDKEVVQYDYGFRIYDPRLVRFKSVDPLSKEYPWYSPYQFAGNSPIQNIDLDGLEEVHYSYMMIDGYRTKLVHEQAQVKGVAKEGAIGSFFSGIKTSVKNWWNSSRAEATQGVLSVTDVDDATVLLYDQHVDGQEATLVDKGLTLVPFVGGKVAKHFLKKAEYLKYLKGNGLTSKVASAVVERGALRGALKIAKGAADIAHHIIPVKLLKENKVVQSAVEAGFDFNSATNGIAIDKALHGSHPNYSNFVSKELDTWAKANEGYSADDARKFIQNTLVPKLETMVDKAKQSSTTLQEAFKTQ